MLCERYANTKWLRDYQCTDRLIVRWMEYANWPLDLARPKLSIGLQLSVRCMWNLGRNSVDSLNGIMVEPH